MARHLRVEFPGAIYHVTCRMVGDWRTEKTLLFKDDADHERFLDRLAERVEQFNIRLYLFVCMTNHFHLVFETPEANCSKFMQSLSTAYTVYYNLRHGRHGHLLDGRYKAKLVEGDDYLLSLSRYVHLNPVQVGSQKRKPIEERIKILRAHRWSSYPSYIGTRKALEFVEYGPLLAEMHGKRREWPKRYREFVESGLAESDDDFKVALKESPRSIGSDGFRAWIDELYQKRLEKHTRPEDVSFRHISEPLPADDVLTILGEVLDVELDEFKRRRHGSPLRAIAARYLIRYAGQSQRDVADYLVIGTGAAVSDQLKRLPEKLGKDRRLRRQVKQAEERLEEIRCAQRVMPRRPARAWGSVDRGKHRRAIELRKHHILEAVA
jgi:REP element-mobilizing transposase RayT